MSVTGRFVKVPKGIATGGNRTDEGGGRQGLPLPPDNGRGRPTPGRVAHDGPQWILERWGDTQAQKVFEFVRVEDIAYDRRPGMQNVVYVVDSGRGARARA